MNIKEKLQQYQAQSDKIIGCGFGDKHGLTLARVGVLDSDDVAVGVNVIQEAICGTQSDPTINIPRTVTVESYRPNTSLYCTFVDDGLFLIQLLSTA